MHALSFLILIFLAISAPGVVLTRDPLKQSIAVSFYGLRIDGELLAVGALYALDELTGTDRQEMEDHLQTCAACRRELQALIEPSTDTGDQAHGGSFRRRAAPGPGVGISPA